MPNIDITIQLMQYIFYRFFVSFQCRNEFQFIEASSSNLLYLQLEHFLSHSPTYFKCLYTVITRTLFIQNTRNRHPIARRMARYGVSFVSTNTDFCPANL